MRSKVAEETRRARIAEEQALSPSQRMSLALAQGRRDLRWMADGGRISISEARRRAHEMRAAGRKPSVANDP
jgi:hypothetical protein